MQYFRPDGDAIFVGDCMPFFHSGTFHLFYLIDRNHHAALGGLGGHQWAHASTRDLVHWEHHPLAIAITDEWEGSICTGSVLYDHGLFYGFYATRMRDWTQHLSLAVSRDGVHFEKTEPNPFASPPDGYNPLHYRDPFIFRDDQAGVYHLLVTACLDPFPIHDRGGCVAHLTSTDLSRWEIQAPILLSGMPDVPECPDYFFWNGWYYLIFSQYGTAHYRMSRAPFGPWRQPKVDTFDGSAAHVMKTAAFTGGRRIGAAWIGTRTGNLDMGELQFGGDLVFRELTQDANGLLGCRFPAEMTPRAGDALPLRPIALTECATTSAHSVRLQADDGIEVAALEDVPRDARITMVVKPAAGSALFGVSLKGSGQLSSGYDLRFLPFESRVELFDRALTGVEDLDRAFTLEIILKDDLIDVCIDQRRCLINRCPELHGDRLFFFALNAAVTFDALEVRPLLTSSEIQVDA